VFNSGSSLNSVARLLKYLLVVLASGAGHHVLCMVYYIRIDCTPTSTDIFGFAFMGRLHKEEMSASKKVAIVGMCMFGVVCLVGIASINILELTHEFRVSRSSEFAIFSRILHLYKYLLQCSC
jgi:hypothetical protein